MFSLQQIFSIVGITQLITAVIVRFRPQNLDHLQWSNNNRRRCKIQITMSKIINMVCLCMLVWLQLHSTCAADPAESQSHSCCAALHTQSSWKRNRCHCVLWSQGPTWTLQGHQRLHKGAKSSCLCGLHQYSQIALRIVALEEMSLQRAQGPFCPVGNVH